MMPPLPAMHGRHAPLQDDREGVAPVIVSMLKAKSEACPPGTAAAQQEPRIAGIPAAVLAKEAVYNAAGVGAYDLHDYIDFKQWFQTALLQVCHDIHSDHRDYGEKTGTEYLSLTCIPAGAGLPLSKSRTDLRHQCKLQQISISHHSICVISSCAADFSLHVQFGQSQNVAAIGIAVRQVCLLCAGHGRHICRGQGPAETSSNVAGAVGRQAACHRAPCSI